MQRQVETQIEKDTKQIGKQRQENCGERRKMEGEREGKRERETIYQLFIQAMLLAL
jgi:hypothetical protein